MAGSGRRGKEMAMTEGKKALIEMLLEARDVIADIVDHIEDEGDRVYFGSTNDADELREFLQHLNESTWMGISDKVPLLQKMKARAEKSEAERDRLREALVALIRAHETGRFEPAQAAYENAKNVLRDTQS